MEPLVVQKRFSFKFVVCSCSGAGVDDKVFKRKKLNFVSVISTFRRHISAKAASVKRTENFPREDFPFVAATSQIVEKGQKKIAQTFHLLYILKEPKN